MKAILRKKPKYSTAVEDKKVEQATSSKAKHDVVDTKESSSGSSSRLNNKRGAGRTGGNNALIANNTKVTTNKVTGNKAVGPSQKSTTKNKKATTTTKTKQKTKKKVYEIEEMSVYSTESSSSSASTLEAPVVESSSSSSGDDDDDSVNTDSIVSDPYTLDSAGMTTFDVADNHKQGCGAEWWYSAHAQEGQDDSSGIYSMNDTNNNNKNKSNNNKNKNARQNRSEQNNIGVIGDPKMKHKKGKKGADPAKRSFLAKMFFHEDDVDRSFGELADGDLLETSSTMSTHESAELSHGAARKDYSADDGSTYLAMAKARKKNSLYCLSCCTNNAATMRKGSGGGRAPAATPNAAAKMGSRRQGPAAEDSIQEFKMALFTGEEYYDALDRMDDDLDNDTIETTESFDSLEGDDYHPGMSDKLSETIVPCDTPSGLKVFVLGKNAHISHVAEVEENGEIVFLIYLKASDTTSRHLTTDTNMDLLRSETLPSQENNKNSLKRGKHLTHLEAAVTVVDDPEGLVQEMPRLVLDKNVKKYLSSLTPGIDFSYESPNLMNEKVRRKTGRVIRAHQEESESDIELTLVRTSSYDSGSSSVCSEDESEVASPPSRGTDESSSSSSGIQYLFCMRAEDMKTNDRLETTVSNSEGKSRDNATISQIIERELCARRQEDLCMHERHDDAEREPPAIVQHDDSPQQMEDQHDRLNVIDRELLVLRKEVQELLSSTEEHLASPEVALPQDEPKPEPEPEPEPEPKSELEVDGELEDDPFSIANDILKREMLIEKQLSVLQLDYSERHDKLAQEYLERREKLLVADSEKSESRENEPYDEKDKNPSPSSFVDDKVVSSSQTEDAPEKDTESTASKKSGSERTRKLFTTTRATEKARALLAVRKERMKHETTVQNSSHHRRYRDFITGSSSSPDLGTALSEDDTLHDEVSKHIIETVCSKGERAVREARSILDQYSIPENDSSDAVRVARSILSNRIENMASDEPMNSYDEYDTPLAASSEEDHLPRHIAQIDRLGFPSGNAFEDNTLSRDVFVDDSSAFDWEVDPIGDERTMSDNEETFSPIRDLGQPINVLVDDMVNKMKLEGETNWKHKNTDNSAFKKTRWENDDDSSADDSKSGCEDEFSLD